MIQEFVVISPRGDTLIQKKYVTNAQRGSSNRLAADMFLAHLRSDKANSGPIVLIEGTTYCHLSLAGMYFLVTAASNVPAASLIEILQRVSRLFKDYCGVLTEETVRRNFLLLYELLDEVLDRGFPQGMSTELLKAYVYNEPVAVSASSGSSGGGGVSGKLDKLSMALADKVSLGEKKTMSSSAAQKPIHVSSDRKDNTIFVDVIERLSLVIDRNGTLQHSYINGQIMLKSFMTGSPEMRLGLNDNLKITSLGVGSEGGPSHADKSSATLTIDDVSFHECVRWEEGSKQPVLTFYAPDGEFALMNYRITARFRPPLSMQPFLEVLGSGLDYVVRIRAEFPPEKVAANIAVTFALPSWASSVSVETAASPGSSGEKGANLSGGKAEVDRKTQVVSWLIPKLPGGAEVLVRAKIVPASHVQAAMCDLSEFGPVRVNFELPMYLMSGVQIKFLDFIYGGGKSPPNKWIRYVTHALSYVGRWS
mmetsp:Transcript_22476/g.35162  ORF Transcript_22476/g.35162 Transcript_22476/m.35162 type:complete len:479 (-) Transcript_22476:1408-2844(-)